MSRADLLRRAAHCYRVAGWSEDACRCLEGAGDHAGAARMHEKLGRWTRAARAYEHAAEWSNAARCFLQADQPEEAADCLLKHDEIIEAGWVLAHHAKSYLRARAVVERVSSESPELEQQIELVLARCDAGAGAEALAARRLRAFADWLAALAPETAFVTVPEVAGKDGKKPRFTCENCGKAFALNRDLAGKRVLCPHCRGPITAIRSWERVTDWALAVADCLDRPDLGTLIHAAAHVLRQPNAERRWEAWSMRTLGEVVGVPLKEADERPVRPLHSDDRMAPDGVPSFNALHCTEKGQGIRVPYRPEFRFKRMTIEMWLWPEIIHEFDVVFRNNTEWADGVGIDFRNDHYLRMYVNTWANQDHYAAGLAPVGKWSHVAASYDEATINFFVNGKLTDTRVLAETLRYDQDPTMSIATTEWQNGVWQFYGSLAEVRVWDHARPEAAIQADMRRKLHGTEAGLMVYYCFDDSTVTPGGNAIDRSVNGNHGVWIGAPKIVPIDAKPSEPEA